MKTIKTKLIILFTIFMVSVVACGILMNAIFLERYYIYKNKTTFITTSKKISDEYINNRGNIFILINEIDRVDGINCTIVDKELVVKYTSFPQKAEDNSKRLPNEIEQLILNNQTKLLNSYEYSVVDKQKEQAPKLVFISRMNSGEMIILKKPMKSINESVSIANQFYIIAGLIIIPVGGIFIFIFSKRITDPVIEMSNVAEDISKLDFNNRVIYDSQDELGSLGRSINNISEKLNTSMNDLKQDVERRKLLVRNLSHELKTPIGVIKGYAEGLKFGVAEDKTEKYCNVISEECDRMDTMVKELLNLSMLESGMFQLKISEFNIDSLVKNVINRFESIFIEEGITVELNCQNDLLISADYELLERVVNNYITNAINHAEGMKQIKVNAEKKGKGIRISVFNTGNHIPDNDLENIWDVFYKVDKARSRKYGGHGLGLSIVRLIVELHSGIKGVENVNEGVRFFIEIPQDFNSIV